MEYQTILASSLSALLLLLAAFNFFFLSKRRYNNLPPSPPSRLFIGHLHLMKHPFHRSFRNLSEKYGSIMSLRFGSRIVVVISSGLAAKECFTKNDIILANRPNTLTSKYISYNHTTLTTSPYGDHWRNLRRITSIEIFSSRRLNMFLGIRRDEIRRLLFKLSRNSRRRDFARVELKSLLHHLTFNNVMRMVAGKRYDDDDDEMKRLRGLLSEVTRAGGVFGEAASFLPILSWIGNYKNKAINIGKRADRLLQGLVDEHRNNNSKSGNTMIDHLLALQESDPEYYTDQIIKGLILTMLLAGSKTVAMALEWAMTNLLNHPEMLNKAREEIQVHVGDERLIDEPDVAKLIYLQKIMWETLRLYPPAPLLVPHVPSEDCTIGGYDVPRGTTVFINAFAIHRDPNFWDDPESFKPDRFEEEPKESQMLMPFGLGRRACPGAALAQRLVSLTLGSMIQCFEWKKIGEEKIDMTEENIITMPKAQPLEAMCKALPIVDKVLYGTDKNLEVCLAKVFGDVALHFTAPHAARYTTIADTKSIRNGECLKHTPAPLQECA